ncbi:hypothetical protein [Xanthobacter pseudotagetidis]|uniref:hypothetical protein n=1 Tax=Xanthobacter pseudotagetidis TaxID=3119911 RepID=UPI003728CDCA
MDRTVAKTNVRFYPDGYIGLEQATLKIAKYIEPDEWRLETFLDGEDTFWSGLAITSSAVAIDTQLWLRYKECAPEDVVRVYARVQSFLYAQQQLQKWLFSGELVGEYLSEAGQWGWIHSEGWSTAAGLDILERGVATLDDDWVRLVLLREDKLEKLLREVCVPENNGRDTRGDASPTSGEEGRLIKKLAELLKKNKDMSKVKAAELLGISHRSRPYELRIWPGGREAAGLARRAKVGRKKSLQ